MNFLAHILQVIINIYSFFFIISFRIIFLKSIFIHYIVIRSYI